MKITIIIPYKEDRGWLQEAIDSVPKTKNVQLILSQGDGNWPQNFNKALPQATGDLIKFLHEDDMLCKDVIDLYLQAFMYNNVSIVHGRAVEIRPDHSFIRRYVPKFRHPTFKQLYNDNVLHSATLMYKREVFEKIGGFNEDPKMFSFEEYEFNLRALKAGFQVGYIDADLAFYRRHKRQIIRTVDTLVRQRNRYEMLKNIKA